MNTDRNGYAEFKRDVLIFGIIYCVVHAHRRGWLTPMRVGVTLTGIVLLGRTIKWMLDI